MKRYIVIRDCCMSGNCDICSRETPLGIPKRITHLITGAKRNAEKTRDRWVAYRSEVIEDYCPTNFTDPV